MRVVRIVISLVSFVQFDVAYSCAHRNRPSFLSASEGEDAKWLSVTTNYEAIHDSFAEDKDALAAVLSANAIRVLGLE